METTEKKAVSAQPATRVESALDRLLKRIRQTEEFPSISKYVIEINRKLALNPDTSNATDLANVILKDQTLTSRLLKMVNSAFYGLAAGQVSTITRAVVILGYENVRLAALSLALFEHFESNSNSTPLKEALVGSFWSGMMARELAAMDDCVDPEEAFICAMMSHLGKLVMIYHLPDEYRQICTLMADNGIGEAKAVKSVCGVTYDELGVAVAQQWNFPPQICDAMQPLTRDELHKKTPPQRIQAVTSFVADLYDTIHDGRLSADTKRLSTLLKRYHPHITVSKKQLEALVKRSLKKVHQHAQALNLDVAQSKFLDRLTGVYEPQTSPSSAEKHPESSQQAGESFIMRDENQLKTGVHTSRTRNSMDIIMQGVQELSQIMMSDGDMDTIAAMSLEIVYRALDFQRALMFIQESGGKRMAVRFGYGHHCQPLIGSLNFELAPSKDLFNLSIQIGKDLIVADAYDEKINHLIPPWYRQKIDAPSFVFLPIVYQKVCIGALYADRNTAGLPVSETEHSYLGMLRNQIMLSIKYNQQSA